MQDGSPMRHVYLREKEAEYEISSVEDVNKNIEELRKKFSDLSEFQLEKYMGDHYEFKNRFLYDYTWKGDPIKAFLFAHKRGQRVIELGCLARADSYDRAEFDKIIRSYFHY